MTTQFRLSVLTAACLSASYSSVIFAEATPSEQPQTLATIVITANREG